MRPQSADGVGLTSDDVVRLYQGLQAQGIRVWLDGGWCVDALLGRQTREHTDLDLAVERRDVSALRGYLANAEKVRVRGAEIDAHARLHSNFSLYGAAAYTDGKYVSFPDAPPPLEDTGGPAAKDVSGSVLPGISNWALSIGGEYARARSLFGQSGFVFGAIDTSYRSSFSSSPSYSRYLIVDGYSLLNARIGFRAGDGWAAFLWSRNLLDKNYFELLTAAPGNTGLFVGQPGDGRTIGLTLRLSLHSR